VVLTIVAVAVVFAVGAVSAYGDLASDTTAPTTTSNAGASYWDDAVITLTAGDDEGIAYIYHELDNGIARLTKVEGSPLSASVEAPLSFAGAHKNPGVGTHTLKYWAQDINGNVEAQKTLSFEVVSDTVQPTTSAWVVAALRGRVATLKYRVNDPEPTKGTATVEIKIKNRAGKVVKTMSAGTRAVNVPLTKKFRCGLAKGTYRYYVYATDASGNAQSKVGSARLTVR
jgi:hypothetical protein